MERESSPALAGLETGEEVQSSVELAPKSSCPETFSLQSLVSGKGDTAPRPTSQASKKLTFQQDVFKFSPMCYHPKRRRTVLTEHNQEPAPEAAKIKPPLKQKTVSFSTTQDKENDSPEDIDLQDSLELEPQVPLDTPNTKASHVHRRGQSADPAAKLIYCVACDRDTRTMIVFESLPMSALQQLMCCWNRPQKQVLAVHKCIKCKRVIARLAQ